MTREDLVGMLQFYFPWSYSEAAEFGKSDHGSFLIERLATVAADPLTRTHLNQLLHFAREAGVSEGFFRYYFSSLPETHPYAVDRVLPSVPELNANAIGSFGQMRYSLHRFFIDSMLYFGDLRSAYESLRDMSYDQLRDWFAAKRFDSARMQARGPVLPFHHIPPDDRYLIAEIACKAYSPIGDGSALLIEDVLLKAYRERGGGRIRIKDLFDDESQLANDNRQAQMMLQFTTEEFADDSVDTEEEIREKVQAVARRFSKARERAIENTYLYLSIVNELDVYVATSMRRRADFREMSRDCDHIFKHAGLTTFNIRYFDPTLGAARGHEDKGLIECLMVKCAKALVYFAGESDSFGKDAEISMALSLGEPVIILCPNSPKGEERMQFFRDVHPLSRLIQMDTGVAVGAMVTNDASVVAELLARLFDNRMEYELEHDGDGYFRLRERLTQSVVRLLTNDRMLRESFWNYYHRIK